MNLTIRNFKGEIRQTMEAVVSSTSLAASNKKQLGHHIIVIDRSGSMYCDISALKDTIKRILTVDDFKGSDMLISLISYSTVGDVTCHFKRIALKEVMKIDSTYLKEIDKIRSSCLTCISQALKLATTCIDDSELTGITLHSDGFANSPSSYEEKKNLIDIAKSLQGKNVFINTIAYNTYSDFVLLSDIANCASGTCVQAKDTKQVYDAIYASCDVVNASGPTLEVKKDNADFVIYKGNDPFRLIGSDKDFSVKGAKDGEVIKFTTSKADADATNITRKMYYILARYYISVGQLNNAKYALFSSGNKTLFDIHFKALTSFQIGEFATDMENAIKDDSFTKNHIIKPYKEMIPNMTTVADIISALEEHKDCIRIDRKSFLENYKPRSIKRLQGVRKDDGTIEEPIVKEKEIDVDDFVRVNNFEFSRSSATINMNIARRVQLVERATEKPVLEVAGIDISDLKTYRNYTLVSDGDVYAKELKVKFEKKTPFSALKIMGVVSGEYEPGQVYAISLDRPVCPLELDLGTVEEAIADAMAAKIINGMLTAISKEVSAEYKPEQVEELKKYCLSKALYINFPTTNPYVKLEDAISAGEIDSRTTYKIRIGTINILSTEEFKSANKQFQRYYTAKDKDGKKIDDAKLSVILENAVLESKTLSARSKETVADVFQKELMDAFIGTSRTTKTLFEKICKKAKANALVKSVCHMSGEELLLAIEDAKSKIKSFEEKLWNETLCPLVFYIGSTGLVPDELDCKMVDAEQLVKDYPQISLSKDEKNGMFFISGNVIISVYPEDVYFSIKK